MREVARVHAGVHGLAAFEVAARHGPAVVGIEVRAPEVQEEKERACRVALQRLIDKAPGRSDGSRGRIAVMRESVRGPVRASFVVVIEALREPEACFEIGAIRHAGGLKVRRMQHARRA